MIPLDLKYSVQVQCSVFIAGGFKFSTLLLFNELVAFFMVVEVHANMLYNQHVDDQS